MALEVKQTLFEFFQRREIVGREELSLNDGEVDFDLIEPTGVDWSMNEDGLGPFFAQTFGRLLTSMSRAVVHNPKDSASRFVGLLTHDLADQPIHGSDSALDFTATEDFCAMDIPSRQVGPGALAKVLVLDASGTPGSWRECRLFAPSGLNAGLFVGGNNIVIRTQRGAFPNTFVKIEDRPGFIGEVGIAREDPGSMLPRAEGIAAEPAPQCSAADLRDQALRNNMPPDLLDREPGQRKPESVRKLAGECLNLNDEAGGKSGLYARLEAAPQGRAVGQARIVYAIC